MWHGFVKQNNENQFNRGSKDLTKIVAQIHRLVKLLRKLCDPVLC